MKDTPVSNLERAFILDAILGGRRTDGRHVDERRNIEIHFGSEFGSCVVSLGQTRVSAQVSCSVMEPRATRSNEGMVFIHVEFPPMCSQRFINKAYGGVDDEVTEVTRQLERCLKESKAVDTESLCIVTEEKVWAIRLDIRVLNHEGNVTDCASIAGLSALAHFRRPDVSLDGNVVTIHPTSEKDPVKLAINHYPVCTTYGFFTNPDDSSKNVTTIKDPSSIEESVMDGKVVLGMNPNKEICTLHLAGKMMIDKHLVLKLTHSAGENAKSTVELIKNALYKDEELRKSPANADTLGLAHSMKRLESILANERMPAKLDIEKMASNEAAPDVDLTEHDDDDDVVIEAKEDGIVELHPSIEDLDQEETVMETASKSAPAKKLPEVIELESDGDSEEETTHTLSGTELGASGRKWYKNSWNK